MKSLPQKNQNSITQKGFDFSNDKNPITIDVRKAARKYILNFLKAAESSGGKQLNHDWLQKGPNAGERAIGPYAFMPSTVQDLVSKDKNLKSKYGKVLNLSYGNFEQSEIEDFFKKNPKINDDLANHYIDKIVAGTSARTAEEISQAWLYGVKGYNKQQQNASSNNPTGIPQGDEVTAARNARAADIVKKQQGKERI